MMFSAMSTIQMVVNEQSRTTK